MNIKKQGHSRCRECYGCIGVLAGAVGTHGPEGVWGHQGALGVSRGCRGVGAIWGVRALGGVVVCCGLVRDSRYSGARRGIGASGGPRGVWV